LKCRKDMSMYSRRDGVSMDENTEAQHWQRYLIPYS